MRTRAGGFTYLGLIILVAVFGMVGAASLKIGALLQRAAAEEELLEIGAAFSDALRSYAAATPQGKPQQPPTLQDLLRDPRFPNPRRHLRKIFVDPITGKAEWGIMYLGDKVGVLGVYSLSNAKPLKVGNFDSRFLNMENKTRLSEWKFTLSSQTMLPGQVRLATPPVPNAPPSLFPPPATGVANAPGGAAPLEPPSEPPAPVPEPAPEPEPAATPMEPKSDEEKAEEEKDKAEREKAEAEKAEAEKGEGGKEPRPEDTRLPEQKTS